MSYDSRTELLIRKIMGETVVLEPPRSRIEELLYLLVDLGVSGGASSSDLEALAARIATIESAMSGTAKILGITTTALTDEATTSTITVAGESVTPSNGDIAFYESGEYLYSTVDNKWHLLGSTIGTVTDVTVNGTSVVSISGTAEIPKASIYDLGVVKGNPNGGVTVGITGDLITAPAATDQISPGTNGSKPIVPLTQHISTFYGLAKAAGDATQAASDNAVGTYTSEAKAAIKNMLGVGESLSVATSAQIKASDQTTENALTTAKQHESTFYGLAKAAGDTSQAQSNNAVGTYTNEALIAISNMLGLETSFETVTVSGTDPVVTAEQNKRYICGEVATLSFTPSSTGICEVTFISGTTPTVLTLPQTVRMPEWFEVEAEHTYEISILDGVYGAVMLWED